MPSDEPAAAALHGRLHPATLIFTVVGLVRSTFFPLVIALLAGRRVAWYLWAILGFAGLSLLWSVARYFTFTYSIAGGELVIRHGLVGKQERHIPLARVQDVRLEQGVVHRVFGVVKVDIETAGGSGAEASLSVLSVAEADRLRQAIFAQVPGAAADGGADILALAAAAAAPSVLRRSRGEGETLWQVPLKDLVLAGLTANHLGTVMAVLFGGFALVDDLVPEESEKQFYRAAARLLSRGLAQAGAAPWVVIGVAIAAGLASAAVFSVAGSILLYFGFRLGRDGEDLHRGYGLLTRRASRLPRRRIQVLKIEEEFLRRLLGLATLRADTAGGAATAASQQDGGAHGGRDVLVPVLPRASVPALLPQFFPDLEPEPETWRRVSPRAVRREALPGVWLSLFLSAGLTAVLWNVERLVPAGIGLPSLWWGALPLLLVPVSIVSSVLSYRHLGYALGARYFRTRRGALSRAEHIVPLRNVQAVILRQTPFDRRQRLARLQIDSAGQVYTGGGPQIEHLPVAEAIALARTLAREAERQRYRWDR